MIAWALTDRGCAVTVFDRGRAMDATSAASTKLLHGGLRYLEHGAFALVREALRERTWWVRSAPHLAQPLRLLLPVYRDDPRRRATVGLGLRLYDLLAGRHSFGTSAWIGADAAAQAAPIEPVGLRGGYLFYDAQMDDRALGLWALEQVRARGVEVHEDVEVDRVAQEGHLTAAGAVLAFDAVVNAAGPWAGDLLERSGVSATHRLDRVRGSHLLLRPPIHAPVLFQHPRDRRVVFALPFQGQLLLGTTEVRHETGTPIVCTVAERDYLLEAYNHRFTSRRSAEDIVGTFAGIRPLLYSAGDPSGASREYAIERRGRLLTVFGGKWTTSRALGVRVAKAVMQALPA